jgi:Polysaccharide deacetylase
MPTRSAPRVLAVDAASAPRVGRKHFRDTLALAPKEVVLTFDDGPESGTTASVLDTLKRECVPASFFLLGRNALAHPELARRELAEGHTVAHHTFSHPLLDRMPAAAAEAEIDRGFAAVDTALYGHPDRPPRTPFFRFPGFASSPPLLDRLEKRGIVVFGADLWRATGTRCRRSRSFNSFSAESRPIAAESCCSTIPRSRPQRCSRPCSEPSRAVTTASFMSFHGHANLRLSAVFHRTVSRPSQAG